MSIKLEELATHWRTILRDIHSIQTHIGHLRELSETRVAVQEQQQYERQHQRSGSHLSQGDFHHHTRQNSSDVFGPPAGEIFQLQSSTCEFWTRCVNMYLERTTDRIKNSVSASPFELFCRNVTDTSSTQTYRLRKTIPLRRRGSMPQLNRRLSNFTIEVAVQFQRNSSSVSTLALVSFP